MSHRAKNVFGPGSAMPDRWMAEVYHSDGLRIIHSFEEIEDLDELIERGPDWNTIEQIVITLNRPTLSVASENVGGGQ